MPLKIYEEKKTHPLQGISNIIAVAAGKGGVGKSTVAVNLALSLKKMGFQVGIMDIDLYGPSIRKMLPEDRLPEQKGGRITPAICFGIKMISMAYFRRENEASAMRAPIANNVIIQFIRDVDWGTLDFLIIDFPPGTGDIQLTLCQQANLTGALMVTTPQEVAVLDVTKAIHLFNQVKIPVLGIVENMSFYKDPLTQKEIALFGQGGGERLANESGIPFLGKIPIDPEICRAGDKGISLFSGPSSSYTEGAKAFVNLAELLVKELQLLEVEKDCLNHFELVWKDLGTV